MSFLGPPQTKKTLSAVSLEWLPSDCAACSENVEYIRCASLLREVCFTRRGYNKMEVDAALKKVLEIPRRKLLIMKKRCSSNSRVPFAIPFSKKTKLPGRLLKEPFDTLRAASSASGVFRAPQTVASRAGRTVQSFLCSTRLREPQPESTIGCPPCGKHECRISSHITACKSITSASSSP